MSTITSRTRTLSNSEQSILENALRVASLDYSDSVKTFKDAAARMRHGEQIPMFAPGEAGVVAAESMVVQFQRQHDDTVALWEKLQESETVAITMPEED